MSVSVKCSPCPPDGAKPDSRRTKRPSAAVNNSGRSQSPSTVSQQQNNSQTSDQNHSEAGYNTLQSGQSLHITHK
ncbi:axonemal dynein light chain domain-containing 1-like protein [Labeo rohita]|uniref:Axonemal dynein light chain domain-containing 1-like protein n=1 Tax=Labeo rohita TaxID=84645 RepID=A0A498L7K0_LABRO|nr:axonemal dynein light chain domain-containing 1-like protein [Labeo rohita]